MCDDAHADVYAHIEFLRFSHAGFHTCEISTENKLSCKKHKKKDNKR